MKFAGFIVRISEKHGKMTRKPYKPWHLYSLKLQQPNGQEYEQWVSLGFRDEPTIQDLPISEGDFVELEANEDDRGNWKVVEGSAKKTKAPTARPTARPTASSGASRSSGSTGNTEPGPRYGYRTDPEDAKRITWSNARDHAIQVVGLLLLNKALPLSGATGKAAEAKRFDEVKAAIDKLTVELYNDSMSLRKLDTVSDTVPDTKPDAALPSEKVGHAMDKTAAETDPEPEDDDDGDGSEGMDGFA